MSFAIIETGGKQYKVKTGDKVKIEKIDTPKDGAVSFDRVLLHVLENGETVLGAPTIPGHAVTGKMLSEGRNKKLIVFKFHSKNRQHTKKGHRQGFTEVLIEKI